MNRSCSLFDKHEFFNNTKIYFVLAILCAFFAFASPFFASAQNIINILLASSTIGLLTVSAAFVIGSGGIDLSIGSLLALCGACSSILASLGAPWYLVALACLVCGAAAGAMNGLLIAIFGIPAFIATLGMLSMARGLALIITDGRPVYGLPDGIVFLGQGTALGLPMPVWFFLVIGFGMQVMLRTTVFGSRTLCIGDNEQAAYNAGINVRVHKILLYVLSGLLAGFAGLIFMGRVNAADPSAGLMYELSAVTGAILGGTHLFGGRASVIGAMVGALVMGVLQNGLTLLAIPSYYQQVAIGLVLIAAVALDRNTKRI